MKPVPSCQPGPGDYGKRVSDEKARAWAAFFVIHSPSRSWVLHVPAIESKKESPIPLCDQRYRLEPGNPRVADSNAYPLGHRPIYNRCHELLASLVSVS